MPRGLMTPLAQEDGVTPGMPRDLALRRKTFETHEQPAGWMPIDSGDHAVGGHHTPKNPRRHAVHDANLDDGPPPGSVATEARSLGVSCLRVRGHEAEAVPRVQHRRAVPDVHFECG